ncbi:MAG: MATE family efflux transporter [Faecousia sp.]
MHNSKPIFYRALMLTGVNLLLRVVGTSFHVYLSRHIGAAGIGLLQLVMSVGNLAMVAGIAGIRTATMYLTAEELGKSRPQNVGRILSSCFLYSILCSCTVAAVLYFGAPMLAEHWIGNVQTIPALKIFAAFLPAVCLSGVMSGYFTAANRIGTLAMVEVAEQLCSMAVTMLALLFWAGQDAERSCISVVLGSSISACVTLALLVLLRLREHPARGKAFPVRRRLLHAAVPLAGADVIRSGIGTTENLLVPKRLARCSQVNDPLSAFGRVSGMVFPLMMFPACILYALAELLIPELARCNAAGSEKRIKYLVRKSLWAAMLYGVFFSGLIFLFAEPLCQSLYHNDLAGKSLRYYALMIPFLYCDAITDAMTKGLGQQKICVRYNIFTSAMDVVLLFLLLPVFGMKGYFFSFLVTHLLNFALSLRRLCIITGCHIPFATPALAASAGLLAAWTAGLVGLEWIYVPLFFILLYWWGVLEKEDIRWAKRLILRQTTDSPIPG